jgi:hypothetical protein
MLGETLCVPTSGDPSWLQGCQHSQASSQDRNMHQIESNQILMLLVRTKIGLSLSTLRRQIDEDGNEGSANRAGW